MTFMIIWHDDFLFSVVRAENVFRVSIGRIVFVLFSQNMETRQFKFRQEIDITREFLCHLLRHPAVRETISEIPNIERSREGVIYHFPDGEYIIPSQALDSWSDEEAA